MSTRYEASTPRPTREPQSRQVALVTGANKGLGLEIARQLGANAAHPGWVKTDLGTDRAPLEVCEGAQTAVALALLPDDGPNGQFFHQGETLPW